MVDASPILGIRGLVHRRTASGRVMTPERLTPAQALHADTVGTAYASYEGG